MKRKYQTPSASVSTSASSVPTSDSLIPSLSTATGIDSAGTQLVQTPRVSSTLLAAVTSSQSLPSPLPLSLQSPPGPLLSPPPEAIRLLVHSRFLKYREIGRFLLMTSQSMTQSIFSREEVWRLLLQTRFNFPLDRAPSVPVTLPVPLSSLPPPVPIPVSLSPLSADDDIANTTPISAVKSRSPCGSTSPTSSEQLKHLFQSMCKKAIHRPSPSIRPLQYSPKDYTLILSIYSDDRDESYTTIAANTRARTSERAAGTRAAEGTGRTRARRRPRREVPMPRSNINNSRDPVSAPILTPNPGRVPAMTKFMNGDEIPQFFSHGALTLPLSKDKDKDKDKLGKIGDDDNSDIEEKFDEEVHVHFEFVDMTLHIMRYDGSSMCLFSTMDDNDGFVDMDGSCLYFFLGTNTLKMNADDAYYQRYLYELLCKRHEYLRRDHTHDQGQDYSHEYMPVNRGLMFYVTLQYSKNAAIDNHSRREEDGTVGCAASFPSFRVTSVNLSLMLEFPYDFDEFPNNIKSETGESVTFAHVLEGLGGWA